MFIIVSFLCASLTYIMSVFARFVNYRRTDLFGPVPLAFSRNIVMYRNMARAWALSKEAQKLQQTEESRWRRMSEQKRRNQAGMPHCVNQTRKFQKEMHGNQVIY